MNQIHGSFLACLIALGFKHNPLWKKLFHALLCFTIFLTSYKLLWSEQIHLPLYLTVTYILVMIVWTFYERYPLYQTYAKLLGGIGYAKDIGHSPLKGHLALQPYTPQWKEQFLAEYQRTRPILLSKWKHTLDSDLTPDGIVHIGSTAIKDIALAKPQHDVALAVTFHSLPQEFLVDLANLGYAYVGVAPHSLDCGDHFFAFIPDAEDRLKFGEGFFLHVVTPKVHDWLRTSLAFCEYLSNHVEARESYSNLKKQSLSMEMKMFAYSMNKYDLVMKLRREAKAWIASEKRFK